MYTLWPLQRGKHTEGAGVEQRKQWTLLQNPSPPHTHKASLSRTVEDIEDFARHWERTVCIVKKKSLTMVGGKRQSRKWKVNWKADRAREGVVHHPKTWITTCGLQGSRQHSKGNIDLAPKSSSTTYRLCDLKQVSPLNPFPHLEKGSNTYSITRGKKWHEWAPKNSIII